MEKYASSERVPGSEAIASVAAASPNDSTRNQTGDQNPYRFCVKAPHVANPDNMGSGEDE